jgi:hypothetical protein
VNRMRTMVLLLAIGAARYWLPSAARSRTPIRRTRAWPGKGRHVVFKIRSADLREACLAPIKGETNRCFKIHCVRLSSQRDQGTRRSSDILFCTQPWVRAPSSAA